MKRFVKNQTSSFSTKIILSTLFLGVQSITLGQTSQIKIESSFEPAAITLSNSTVYKVVIEGSQNPPKGSIPKVPGLNISNNPQTFRKVSLVNGVTSIKLELSFSARASRQGSFKIPSWQLTIDGESHTVPPANLKVLGPSQQDLLRKQQKQKADEDLKQAAFLEYSMPREFLFEGETMVSEISLFLWDRMPFTRIENAPVKVGDSFSLTALGQPNEKRNIIKFNKSYSSYSWTVGLTAAISGKHDLSYHSNVRIRTNNQKTSPFNSPFFNDPFFGFGREESIKVSSKVREIEIRPLPMKGRPPSFSGAIGTFKTSSSIDSETVSLGDPVRLTFSISGNGNFSAMPAPTLTQNNDFKFGPPAFFFSGNEQTKFSGTQGFEYIITPLKPGLLKLPSPNFSFFDPIQEEYITLPNLEHTIRVDPGEKWNEPVQRIEEQTEGGQSEAARSTLFQTESEPGPWRKDFLRASISHSFLFWVVQTIPFSALCLFIFLGFKKRTHGIESLKQQESRMFKELKKCHGFNDVRGFFRAYRALIQFKVGFYSDHPNPFSLSSEELIQILEERNESPQLIGMINSLLQKFDDFEFARNDESRPNLKEEYKEALSILKRIK